eukprot:scaffold6786_cov384-Prasinococcus_capsulatus_cf.AAC.9
MALADGGQWRASWRDTLTAPRIHSNGGMLSCPLQLWSRVLASSLSGPITTRPAPTTRAMPWATVAAPNGGERRTLSGPRAPVLLTLLALAPGWACHCYPRATGFHPCPQERASPANAQGDACKPLRCPRTPPAPRRSSHAPTCALESAAAGTHVLVHQLHQRRLGPRVPLDKAVLIRAAEVVLSSMQPPRRHVRFQCRAEAIRQRG